MAKSRKPIVERPAEAQQELGGRGSSTPAPGQSIFAFNAFHVLGVRFQQVPPVPLAEGENLPPPGQDTKISVGATVLVGAEKIGQLRLSVVVLPNPKIQPCRIEVEVQGTFSTETGTPEQIARFCQLSAPAILFPYIREIVDRVTIDAPYGPVRLNPMNVNQWLNQTPWQQASPAQPEVRATESSIAPEPQHEQSGDVSRP